LDGLSFVWRAANAYLPAISSLANADTMSSNAGWGRGLIVVATVIKVFGSRMGEQRQEAERKSDHNADELTSAAIGVPHHADDAPT